MSLYETAWTVHLRRSLHIPISATTSKRIISAIHLRIAQATMNSPLDLQTIQLAAQTLADLHGTDSVLASRVDMLRDGDGYAATPDEKQSAAATAIAVRALTLNGDKVPKDVTAELLRSSDRVSANATIEDLTNRDLPLIDALLGSVPTAALRYQSSDKASILRAWMATIVSYPAGGVTLGDLVLLSRIAARAGVALPPTPGNYVNSLKVGSTGYLSVEPGGLADAQVTASAADLKLLSRSHAITSTSSAGLGVNGWVRMRAPDLTSNYAGTELLLMCGRSLPALGNWVRAGLSSLNEKTSLKELVLWMRLAGTYHVEVPESKKPLISKASTESNAASGRPNDCLELVKSLELKRLGGEKAESDKRYVECGRYATTLAESVAFMQIAEHADDDIARRTASEQISSYRFAEGWLLNKDQTVPDIISSAMGASSQKPNDEARAKILADYGRYGTWSFAPRSFASRQTSILSVYAAVIIADSHADPNGLLAIL